MEKDSSPVTGGSECILLVDDDQAIRHLGRQFLERFGYRVCEAPDGEGALNTLRQTPPTIDLVILDLNMPGMGGASCLEELRRHNAHLPVLIASGHAPDRTSQATLNRLAQGFIGKPYELKTMLQVVRETLDRSDERG